MKRKLILSLLVVLCSAILIAGCASSPSSSTPAPTQNSATGPAATLTAQYTGTAPVTTETTTGYTYVPTSSDFRVLDNRGGILVHYVSTSYGLKGIDVTLNRADGVVTTKSGYNIFEGSTTGSDHLIVKVTMDDGKTYTVIDNDIKPGQQIKDGRTIDL
jgi:hypothetical protein